MPERRWRDYRTASGHRPVKQAMDRLSEIDAARVLAAMRDVRLNGLRVARHLRSDLYEVRADGIDESYRVFFAVEGRKGRVLLALSLVSKRTQQARHGDLGLAGRRLRDWRLRGRHY